MNAHKAEVLQKLLQCMRSTATDPTIEQRPVIIRFITLQVLYFARVLNLLRSRSFDPQGNVSSTNVVPLPQSLRIAVLGCGCVGSDIVRAILKAAFIHPNCITVSTRQPGKCTTLKAQGIMCMSNNVKAISCADLVIVACLPSQLPTIAADITGKLERHAVVVSVCAGIPTDKVSSLLHHPYCLTTNIILQDVQTFCKLHLTANPLDHFIPYPASPTLANWSYPFRRTADADLLSHAFKCFVGSQVHRDRKVLQSQADFNLQCFQQVLEAMFTSDVEQRLTEDAVQTLLQAPGFSPFFRLEVLGEMTGLPIHALVDYALRQHLAFVT